MRKPAPPHATALSWRGPVLLLSVLLLIGTPSSLAPPAEIGLSTPPTPAPPVAVAVTLPALPIARVAASASPAPAPAAAVTARPLAADEAEVCGLGVVRVDDETPLAARRIPDGVRALALQRLGLAMATSADERVRAAEKLLSARLAVGPGALADATDADAACRRARDLGLEETARFCVEAEARSQLALFEPAHPAIDQLARMAAMSSDPQVYAFAFEACRHGGLNFHGRDGNCSLISAEQWARLSPGDAEPWLHLTAEALARGDATAATAALARVADASAIGAHAGDLPALAAAALPEGMPLLEQTAVLAEFAALDAGAASAGLGVVDTACAEAALRDTARRTHCDAMARMLVERGRSSAAVTAGVQLGERLGWPAERTAALLREQRAALDAALRFAAPTQALACDSLQRQRELVRLTGRLGEIDAGRELLRRERIAQGATQ